MIGTIKKLRDNLHNIIFPVTVSKAVYMEDGQTNLEQKLTAQDNKIGNLSGNGIAESSVAEAIKNDREKLAYKTYVDTQISNIGNASPKGVYSTLSDLQSAYPTGTTGVYVVSADKHWYYWNGTAWADGGSYFTALQESKETIKLLQPDVYMTNKVINGDFSVSNSEWFSTSGYGYASAISITANKLIVKGTTSATVGVRNTASLFEANKKYYVRAKVKITNANCLGFRVGQGTILTIDEVNNPVQNQVYTISKVITTTSATHDFLMFYHWYADAATAIDKIMEIQYVTVIDLTATFGSGNELTEGQMDIAINQFANSWFNSKQRVITSSAHNGEILYIENNNLGYKNIKSIVDSNHISDAFVSKRNITNRIINGDFSSASSGWFHTSAYGKDASLATNFNTLYVTGTTTQGVSVISGNGVFEANKKYYVKAEVMVNNSVCEFIRISQGDILTVKEIRNPVQNQYYIIDGIIDTVSNIHSFLNIYHWYSDAATANGKVMQVKNVVVIDLTVLSLEFSPLPTQIHEVLKRYDSKAWFEGTQTLDITSLYNGKIFGIKNGQVGLVKPSNLTGKKWLVIGDSFTEINGRTKKNYHSFISDWVGGCTVINHGIGGTGWFTANESSANNAIYQRISSLPTDVDVISVLAGINDWSEVLKPLVLGNLGDTNGTVSFYGAVDSTLSQLIAKYPTKPIMVFTPIQRATSFNNAVNSQGVTLKQVVDAIKEVCEKYGIPCLDLYRSSGLFPWNTTVNATYFSCPDSPNGDGLHPNEEGHRILAYRIVNFINEIVGLF